MSEERESKTSGFRLAIPDPMDLYNWGVSQASRHGDMNSEQILDELTNHYGKYLEGSSKNVFSRDRCWQADLNDKLLEKVTVKMDAAYSESLGPWIDLFAEIDFSQLALGMNWQQKLFSKSLELAKSLEDKGLVGSAINEPVAEDNFEVATIIIPGEKENAVKMFVSCYLIKQEEGETDGGIVIRLDGTLPLDFIKMSKYFQRFQQVLPKVVDSLYDVMGVERTDTVLALSPKYEIS